MRSISGVTDVHVRRFFSASDGQKVPVRRFFPLSDGQKVPVRRFFSVSDGQKVPVRRRRLIVVVVLTSTGDQS